MESNLIRCNQCDKFFKNLRGLNIHKAKVHKKTNNEFQTSTDDEIDAEITVNIQIRKIN